MNKVSIIIPVYNAEKYIEKCVYSILNQSYSNIEVILVNDGSKDNSSSLCEKLSNDFKNIKYINQDNKGPSAARNAGIDASNGEFILFIDADDYINSDMISHIVSRIKIDNSDLIVFGYTVIYKDNVKQNNIINTSGVMTQKEYIKNFHYFFVNAFANVVWNKLYKSDIFKKYNIRFNENITLGEDLLFNLEYINRCFNISIEPNCYYNYTQDNFVSLAKKYYGNKIEIENFLFDNIRSFLITNNEYYDNNLKQIESIYFETILSSLNDLCTSKSYDIKNKIDKIINDAQINNSLLYYKGSTIDKRIICFMIKYRCGTFIRYYYNLKKYVKSKRL